MSVALPKLKAPFPWFGGKARAAALIWERLGDVNNYVEPFAGSLAVLLGRPHDAGTETVNDLDCYLANFWRAIAADPVGVAEHADWPVNEADLHGRHTWLVGRAEFRERMKTEPDFYDVRIAGWWVWGLSCWIGGGWCALRESGIWRQRPPPPAGKLIGVNSIERTSRKMPAIYWRGGAGVAGVERKRPQMTAGKNGNVCHGTRRQIPRVDAMCDTGANNTGDLVGWFQELAARMRRVRVACGSWERVLGPTPLGLTSNVPPGFRTAVVLDPPYDLEERDTGLYAQDGTASLSAEVRAWAIAHGDNKRLRIALCGYEGEHAMPATWECVAWKAGGGYANRNGATNDNAKRERIWFSPHCLKPGLGQGDFFA